MLKVTFRNKTYEKLPILTPQLTYSITQGMLKDILLWIPTHILTFSMKYYEDYQRAGIPTFPSTYGNHKTRIIIALSSLGAAIAIATVAYGIGLSWGYLRLFAVLTVGIIGLASFSVFKPSEHVNFGLFKYASLYMLGSMIMVIIGAL